MPTIRQLNNFFQKLRGYARWRWEKLCHKASTLAALGNLRLREFFYRTGKPHHLSGELIVSLTSYPPRFPTLSYTLRSLLRQSVKADRTILWIAEKDMAALPAEVLRLKDQGLDIRATDDIRSYKKIIPTLNEFPHAYICTADDDIYYRQDWLEELVDGVSPSERIAPCHRAHMMSATANGTYVPYKQWTNDTPLRGVAYNMFPTSGAGVLYFPGAFASEATNSDLFLKLCPHADDIWLYWMTRLAKTVYKTVGRKRKLVTWSGSQHEALFNYNVFAGGNDQQVLNMAQQFGYPSLTDRGV